MTADIRSNDISNQTQCIHLESQGCARISDNEISKNAVFGVGVDQATDAGLTLLQGSLRNAIAGNSISHNHGNGITVFNKSSHNNVALNSVRFNATDLTDLSTDSGNTWNLNNLCKTEAGSVPVGVCNPME